MVLDSATSLRNWAKSIEDAWDITIGFTDEGAFVLETQGGVQLGIEPVPQRPALVLTAELGEVDDSTPPQLYQALLALNLDPILSGTGHVGIAPQTRQILLRLVWSPGEEQWQEEAFFQLLAAFGRHAEQLARSIASRDIEKVLAPPIESAAPDAGFMRSNFA
ncbi:type III secretion system chaperone [Acidovorax sp. CCYZU-2555]|uniref:type III secretion system chaperone n=1 Tax=Acidovorax sp. CCYZU-2555 TaxID=2835042 RepID=UPI001BCCD6AD|nr:type III secretion system chaperone [Acidovorax sp. CCYZU-2555]MBS7777955.1 type III secretion system chaperone [Acidovorax sp. CCYZU-2555]